MYSGDAKDKAEMMAAFLRLVAAMERCAAALETLSNAVDVTTDSIRTFTLTDASRG